MERLTTPFLPLLLVGLLLPIQGLAQQRGLEFQVETGTCEYERSPDGMFWQSPQQTNLQLAPACKNASIAGLWGKSQTWGWRLGYHDFGTIRARDNRFMRRDDEIYSRPSGCNPATLSGCMGTMYGEGHNWGISAALTGQYRIGRDFALIGEAGLLFFNSAFHAWATKDEDNGILYAREFSSFRDSPPAPMIGVGARWKYFGVMYRHYESLGHRAQSATNHDVDEVTLTAALPLTRKFWGF